MLQRQSGDLGVQLTQALEPYRKVRQEGPAGHLAKKVEGVLSHIPKVFYFPVGAGVDGNELNHALDD